ncbi:MAG: sigma-70 family RNA polymerase sigma factor [Bryobacteraceae bacterium]|nr:sigma-70 family RNA polymerase sigma factor [Bryobacteraceae bacterium]
MSGFSGALPLPASGERIPVKASVDHRNSDEALLVRRIQRGDELAFREVVERYQSKVFSIIYGILRNRNDAEDIAQQVFAKVYFSIGSFDFRSSLLTWIYKITVNECYDYLRKRRVRKLVYESEFSEEDAQRLRNSEAAVDQAPSVEGDLARRDYVMKLLAKLPDEDRLLMLLKEVEGHSVEELAEMTGLNQNTIKVRLFRARQKLLKAAERLDRAAGAAPA